MINDLPPGRPTRRTVLAAGLGALVAGCSPAPSPSASTPSAPVSSAPTGSEGSEGLARVEAELGGRLGAVGVDTGSGRVVAHRGDERFLLCSTGKVLAVAAVLHRRPAEPGLLDRTVRYGPDRVVPNSPVTGPAVDRGLTVAQLCDAAITRSDNTAMNLLLDVLGGPQAATAYVRGLGDGLTRLDRPEPELNRTSPGDERDTTTPARMAENLRLLTLADALTPEDRARLVGWLDANTTGATRIRAGLPPGWTVGDKTGSGAQGEINDVALVRPPGRAPLIMAVYTSPSDPRAPEERVAAAVSGAARVLAAALVPS